MADIIQGSAPAAPKKKLIPNLLRPQQVKDTKDELARLDHMVTQPHVSDRSMMQRRIGALRRTLEELTPRGYGPVEIDGAKARADKLLADITAGMLTQAEMRANPAGAVGAHMAWEKRNKDKILEWKHIQLRLNAGNEDPDVANIERFRPRSRLGELDMSVAQIARKEFLGLDKAGTGTVINASEVSQLASLDADLAASLSTMNNEQRAVVKEFLKQLNEPAAPTATPAKRGRKAA